MSPNRTVWGLGEGDEGSAKPSPSVNQPNWMQQLAPKSLCGRPCQAMKTVYGDGHLALEVKWSLLRTTNFEIKLVGQQYSLARLLHRRSL